ncbi:Mannan endo-1,6-alpha-mannosidase [Ophiocordyceps camponoti-floridani]|uniref:Mannan endo-1,6-alpha-mannosidase n=1 Tax=Ophiocordyceps camponoti-floridani TaxID=2030778 RepID=A0A8H4VB09_9HYPO|nr:Mannan endo-1,6-alpha-mannosidase [Ophiocordyceps camponoti-floridani]
MRGLTAVLAVAAAALLSWNVQAIEVNVDDEASLKRAAGTAAFGLMKYYSGNNTGDTPGNLPSPYFWWTAGAMFGTIIDYWFLTGDSSYNDATIQAIVHQGADTRDFMPKNQTRTEGNDDQGFWAMTAMTAAENKFPDPPAEKPQYLALVQAVFNQYVQRWDVDDCGGGLRWQIFSFNNGFNYKNSISNGCFFNIAARLARYTGNSTYADWANKIFEWEQQVGLISPEFDVFDGITIEADKQCRGLNKDQWSYNAGIYLEGAAAMSDVTKNETWKIRRDGLLRESLTRFSKDQVLFEQFCEPSRRCNNDQQSFKGFMARWLASTIKLAPETTDSIMPVLRATAQAAAASCAGSTAPGPPPAGFNGQPGTACGFGWEQKNFDGITGVPPQMNAVAALIYPLAQKAKAPVTVKAGGTSKGDPNAGSQQKDPTALKPITAGDKAGAGFLTLFMVAGSLGFSTFLVL